MIQRYRFPKSYPVYFHATLLSSGLLLLFIPLVIVCLKANPRAKSHLRHSLQRRCSPSAASMRRPAGDSSARHSHLRCELAALRAAKKRVLRLARDDEFREHDTPLFRCTKEWATMCMSPLTAVNSGKQLPMRQR